MRFGDYMSLEDCKELIKKHCNFLVDSDIDWADFRFTNVSDVFGMVSFIEDSYILINENFGLKIRDIGSGDVSPKFEHPLHLVRLFKGRPVEYVPINISTIDFIGRFSELFENEFYLMFLDNKNKINKALSKTNKNYVVITSQSIGGEDFFEYMGGLHLKEKGYFVTKWNPIGGSDFFAYQIPDYAEILQSFGIIKSGAFLSELELFPLIKQEKSLKGLTKNKYDIIVCEAEARYNLALRSSTGIGQKIGWVDSYHEVYGVGPTTYIPDSENIHKYFGKRTGAIVFTNTHEKIEIEPLELGFTEENYEIKTVKLLIKSIFLHKLLPLVYKNENNTKLTLKDYVRKIIDLTLEEVLSDLQTYFPE